MEKVATGLLGSELANHAAVLREGGHAKAFVLQRNRAKLANRPFVVGRHPTVETREADPGHDWAISAQQVQSVARPKGSDPSKPPAGEVARPFDDCDHVSHYSSSAVPAQGCDTRRTGRGTPLGPQGHEELMSSMDARAGEPRQLVDGGYRDAPGGAIDVLLADEAITHTVAERVAQRLRELIVEGHLPPGSPLRLAPLAARLGVSVMPVRDALRRLEADHMVILTPRRGAVVADLSIDEAEEIYAVRVALEALCARRAVERLTGENVQLLEQLFARMQEAQRGGDLSTLIACDHEFHFALYGFSGRERLIRNITELVNRSRRYAPYLFLSWQIVEDPVEAHRPLLDAIRAHDALLAERLTREHLEGASVRLLSAIQHAVEGRQLSERPPSIQL